MRLRARERDTLRCALGASRKHVFPLCTCLRYRLVPSSLSLSLSFSLARASILTRRAYMCAHVPLRLITPSRMCMWRYTRAHRQRYNYSASRASSSLSALAYVYICMYACCEVPTPPVVRSSIARVFVGFEVPWRTRIERNCLFLNCFVELLNSSN